MEVTEIRLRLPGPLVIWLRQNACVTEASVHAIAGMAIAYVLGALDAGSGHFVVPLEERVLIEGDGPNGACLVRELIDEGDRESAAADIRNLARGLTIYADALERVEGAR